MERILLLLNGGGVNRLRNLRNRSFASFVIMRLLEGGVGLSGMENASVKIITKGLVAMKRKISR